MSFRTFWAGLACVGLSVPWALQAQDQDRDAGAAETLAANHRPALRVDISPRKGLVTGDLVQVRILAEVPKGDDLTVPAQSFGSFELHARKARVESRAGDRQQFVFELKLLAFGEGDVELPPIRVRVVTADGHIGSVATPAQRLHIGTVLGNEPNAQPKAPTRPVRVVEKDYTLLWIGGALLGVGLTALLTLLIARWLRRRKRAAKPPAPPRPAWEVAREKLIGLRRELSARVASGQVAELVDQISDVAREYLGRRFGFDGLETTSDEMLEHLRTASQVEPLVFAPPPVGPDRWSGRPVESSLMAQIRDLLATSDLVKFANVDPDEEACEQLLTRALAIVEQTVPQSVAATAHPASPPPSVGSAA